MDVTHRHPTPTVRAASAPHHMSDPNGKETGIAFLEANKSKDGVIVLPSGLQYKVLEEGPGMVTDSTVEVAPSLL